MSRETYRVVWGFDRSDDFASLEEAETYLYRIRGSALRDPFAAPKLFAVAPDGTRTLILERLPEDVA